MNIVPRRRLAELISQQGRALSDDPRRCKALLLDICGEHKREINVLIAAQEEKIPADLLKSPAGVPRALLLEQLTRRLHDNRGLAEEFARWAVESWALALGIVTDAELQPAPNPKAPPTPRADPDSAQARVRPPQTTDDLSPTPSGAEIAKSMMKAARSGKPRAVRRVTYVGRVFTILARTTRAIWNPRPQAIAGGSRALVSGALAGAVLWSPIGLVPGVAIALFTASGADVALPTLLLNGALGGLLWAAIPGALYGGLTAVIRRFGEVGGAMIGAVAGVACGAMAGSALGIGGVTAGFTTGAMIGALLALVSLGMIGGQGKNMLLYVPQAVFRVAVRLREWDAWVTVMRGVLAAGTGGALLWLFVGVLPGLSIGFHAEIVGGLLGSWAGAIVGDRYKLLRFL
ncbi:MAG: hypothetical protein HY259_12830 [Chloroflexi bacterium]|nr:hypothetical protein [Chloroflexota bacterium]